jgi:hypothetical protein
MASDCVAETSTGDKDSFCRVNIQKLHVLPTEYIFAFCIDLTTNRKYFPMQHLLTGSYNRDAVRLLRGTNLIFKCNSRFFLVSKMLLISEHGNFGEDTFTLRPRYPREKRLTS